MTHSRDRPRPLRRLSGVDAAEAAPLAHRELGAAEAAGHFRAGVGFLGGAVLQQGLGHRLDGGLLLEQDTHGGFEHVEAGEYVLDAVV